MESQRFSLHRFSGCRSGAVDFSHKIVLPENNPHGNYAAWTKKEMFLDWLEVEASVFDVGFS